MAQSGVYEPEEEKFFDKVTDVIIDEASQLSTCWALPLYMTSPEVKNVILMGDPHQLEPFCRFKEDTFLYQIASQSELSRVSRLKDVKTVTLKNIHRCHPKIVDILYKPIYGDEVMAAAPKEKHNLASDRNIEVADKPVDPAPVLFVDYGYVNTEKGVNEKEVEMVVKCVKVMTEVYKIPGKEIAIVCHNRKQLARMQQKFAKQGTIGTFKTSVHIHTVDSFIGGEARVVMVLISKTCQSWTDVERVMQSISDPHRGIVAVSRASDAVYLFGQWKMLVQTEFWGKFVDKIVEERCLVDDGWRPARDHQHQYLVDAKAGKYLVEYEDIV